MAEQRRQVGLRIKEARQAKRWKQKQLAAAVHVEPLTVSRWERGQHMPDLDTLGLVAEVTGRQLSYFITPPADSAADHDGLRDLIRETVIEVLQTEQFPRLEALADAAERIEKAVDRIADQPAARPSRRSAGTNPRAS